MTNVRGRRRGAAYHSKLNQTMGDETYLESFIESIASLPHDVRRNLELLKDMDNNCS